MSMADVYRAYVTAPKPGASPRPMVTRRAGWLRRMWHMVRCGGDPVWSDYWETAYNPMADWTRCTRCGFVHSWTATP